MHVSQVFMISISVSLVRHHCLGFLGWNQKGGWNFFIDRVISGHRSEWAFPSQDKSDESKDHFGRGMEKVLKGHSLYVLFLPQVFISAELSGLFIPEGIYGVLFNV